MARAVSRFFCLVLLIAAAVLSAGQVTKKTAPVNADTAANQGIKLAEDGRCSQAIPLLARAIHQVSDRDLKKKVGLSGINCAMTHKQQYDSLEFLETVIRDFPNDPEVLYAAIHAFSDLSIYTSQNLVRSAPFSYQVHELNAETLESQGRWELAAGEYRKILQINPLQPGIHARLGKVLITKPQPSAADIEEAKQSFETELEIDPNNASAEYVLGVLAKNGNDLSAAVRHLTRATKLDSGFSEAFLDLGTILVSTSRFTEAIPPLETYEKLEPDSPTGHYQLALAYKGVGRKEDANREAALQRQSAEALERVRRRVAQSIEQQQPAQPNPQETQPK